MSQGAQALACPPLSANVISDFLGDIDWTVAAERGIAAEVRIRGSKCRSTINYGGHRKWETDEITRNLALVLKG